MQPLNYDKNIQRQKAKSKMQAKEIYDVKLRDFQYLIKIVHAAQMHLRAAGQRHATNILKEITENPNLPHKYAKAVECWKELNHKISRTSSYKECKCQFNNAPV